ncbi:MAG: hypothetical protein IPJ65_18565 [Archangiaceae bacterium]|nr:hypothetical protein [Archangiaceae bacterium]
MARATVAVAILAAFPTLAAPPALSGLYRAGDLGVVDLQSAEAGRLVARYKGAGSCAFKPEMQVLSGNFEGDVFLGTVFLCQEGPSCDREKVFPFFAVFHEGALAGDVKLDTGCSSRALEGKRLNISMATAEDRLLINQELDNSASSIATKNANRKELEKLARESLTQGLLKLKEQNFAAARTQFERSLTYDDSDWKTWSYLGQVELKLGNVQKGLESIQKAVVVAGKSKPHITDEEMGDLFYNQSCAQSRNGKKREAVNSLRNALKVGDVATLLPSAQQDPDLDAVREEPDFKRALVDAKNRKDKRGAR